MNALNNIPQPVFYEAEQVPGVVATMARIGSSILWETVQTVAAIAVIHFSTLHLFPPKTAIFEAAYMTCVLAPVLEEILFRGIIQGGVRLIQFSWNKIAVEWVRQEEITSEMLKTQEVFRVRITAVLFGLAHLLNPHPWPVRLMQVTWCIICGSNFGYLKEKHQTLALPMLAHFSNNLIATLAIAEKISPGIAFLGVGLQQIALGIYVHNEQASEFLQNSWKKAKAVMATVQLRLKEAYQGIVNWNERQYTPIEA